MQKPNFVKNADSASDDVINFGKIWFIGFDDIFYSIESIPDFSMVLDSLDSTLQNWFIMSYSKNSRFKRYEPIFDEFWLFSKIFRNSDLKNEFF